MKYASNKPEGLFLLFITFPMKLLPLLKMDIETSAVLEDTLGLFNMFNSWSVRLCDQGIQYHLGDPRYITLFSFSKQSV